MEGPEGQQNENDGDGMNVDTSNIVSSDDSINAQAETVGSVGSVGIAVEVIFFTFCYCQYYRNISFFL